MAVFVNGLWYVLLHQSSINMPILTICKVFKLDFLAVSKSFEYIWTRCLFCRGEIMYLYHFVLRLAMTLSVFVDFTFFSFEFQGILYDFVVFFMIELVRVSMVWLACWKFRVYVISARLSLFIVLPSWSHDLTRTYHYCCYRSLIVIALQVVSRVLSVTFGCVIISKVGYTYVFVFVFLLSIFAFVF